ncbi:mannose-P-dolichol utilization defect 1-like protein 2 [Chlorella sorokiniana]|jgi:mannose-P-dolichol utilization defect protein 1|uniref:Mannose-P-dolichol utilization defect 1 protein homolog n=1 Tax=Chlorella sorokiniana TaxID=3076 RepID=A0A2P6U0H4_CHLSO|nr:mannose-P-dolichol utilization defect 1-like protein 2 [Chlorella sorokiniana]|eukprot:PRW59800.1 mannose-P-dolichol utilization defect 1-like protein 2 [Chlorella sorokiniana]
MSDLLQLLRLALGELAHGRFPHNDILKPLISKVLGYGILAGSTMVKLPQVAAVVRARSAAGLSPLSFELETLGLVIAVTYGFLMGLPFSAFGETVALLIQNNILLLLIYHYQRRRLGRTLLLVAVLAAAGWVAMSGQLSAKHITALYDCNNAILILSRVPQIWANLQAGGTGQLSLITYALNTAGAAARIFTSIQEKAGSAMLRGAVISTLLNAVLALQIVWYKGGGATKNAGRRGKKKAT